MALEIFKLLGGIYIDNTKANDSISKTDKKAQGLSENFIKGVNKAAKWGTAIAGAAVAGATAMVGLATKVSDTLGTIDDGAKKVGTSAEEYQKWAYAAKLGGMEMATLEKAMIKQQKAFADAKEGSKAMSEAYQRIGIDITNIGSSSEAFNLVIARLADMEDETTRNALANDIFGKSYAELAPLLAEGSQGIEAWKNEAVELGAVLTNDAVEAGANFGDSIDRVKTAAGGLVNKIGVSLMPTIERLLAWITKHMPEIQKFAEKCFNGIAIAIQWVIDNSNWLIPVLSGLFGAIVALNVINGVINLMNLWKASTLAQTIAQGGLNAVLSANPIGIVVLAIGAAIAAGVALWRNWDTVKKKASALWNSIRDTFTNIKNKVGSVVDSIKGFFNFNWKLPHIKLPHFKVSGSANPLKWLSEGVPRLSVDWYSQGAIFTQPTILGGIGVGDANNGRGRNAEAILPIDELPRLLREAGMGGMTVNIYSPEPLTPSEIARQIKNTQKKLSLGMA